MNDEIDILVTKWALTTGIFKARARKTTTDGMVCVLVSRNGAFSYYLRGDDWHESAQDAIARAEAMRIKAVQAALRKLDKLRRMSWEIRDGDVVKADAKEEKP